MRKIVWLLFLSMLLLFSVSLPAWADGTTVEITSDKTELNVGDEVIVDVKVENVTNLGIVGFEISFDEDILKYISYVPTALVTTDVPGKFIYMRIGTTSAGSVCKIKFEAIKPGTCEIKISSVVLSTGSEQIPFTITKDKINISVAGIPSNKSIIVNLDNELAVNTQRSLGITASAKEDSQSVSVTWDVKIKNETGTVIKTFPSSVGTTFNETWTPTITDIPADLPMASKNYKVEIKATYVGDEGNEVVTETKDFTLSNYDLVIKKVEYAGGKINVTVENLAQETKNNVDCILQISKADGTLVNLEFKPADIVPGEKTIEYSIELSAGNYKAEVFLWDFATWQTLSSPKEINFTV